MLLAAAQAVEQVHRPLRLMLHTPAQHAHHGGDADAAANQHHRHVGVGVDEEMSCRRFHAQHVPHLHVIMEVGGDDTRARIGVLRGRGHALDGDAVSVGAGFVRQGVTAREGVRGGTRRTGDGAEVKTDREVLARLELRQGLAIDGLKVEGTLGTLGVLQHALDDAELPPSRPGRRSAGRAVGGIGRACEPLRQRGGGPLRHPRTGLSAPQHHADAQGQLQEHGRGDQPQQFERGHQRNRARARPCVRGSRDGSRARPHNCADGAFRRP